MEVEYEDDSDSMGNIDYDALNDLSDYFPQFLEDTDLKHVDEEALGQVLQMDGGNAIVLLESKNRWDKVTLELTKHGPYDDEVLLLSLFL